MVWLFSVELPSRAAITDENANQNVCERNLIIIQSYNSNKTRFQKSHQQGCNTRHQFTYFPASQETRVFAIKQGKKEDVMKVS